MTVFTRIRKAIQELFRSAPPVTSQFPPVVRTVNDNDSIIDIMPEPAVGFGPDGLKFRTAFDFPVSELSNDGDGRLYRKVGDSKTVIVGDDYTGQGEPFNKASINSYEADPGLMSWYSAQGFIGYQSCALIAQHWLVSKACRQQGEDAVRNGWDLNVTDGTRMSAQIRSRIKKLDRGFGLSKHLVDFVYFTNVFGIRVAVYHVESEDPKYYEKPFNPDGIMPGSYKGIKQVDPYWMMPTLSMQGQSEPTDLHFYEPEFWVISGKKYHRSHLVILKGPQPADILKPTYIFGGIPLTQRIYERVYAAERTANEGPLLAMNKRTTVLHLDVKKAAMQFSAFMERIGQWLMFRDNHQIKVLGNEEKMEQFDTSLADFDSVVMNQYQLVAAIAETPATKLLGTSPKGFNATGDAETESYHEALESTQADITPMLDRHYICLIKSHIVPEFNLDDEFELEVVWNPVNNLNSTELAAINKTKAESGKLLVDGGIISADEERGRLRDDKHSGYNSLSEDTDAETTPGVTPENEADLMAAEAKQTAAEAKIEAVQGGDVEQVKDEASANPQSYANIMQEFKTSQVKYAAESQEPVKHFYPGMNPRLPKMKVQGFNVVIENPKSSIRSGQALDGTLWRSMMPCHYGYIKGVMGADGDELDAFVGTDPTFPVIYVINQICPETGEFDEHKCMMGFNSPESARAAYDEAYSKDWKGFHSLVIMRINDFKWWIKGDLSGPCNGN